MILQFTKRKRGSTFCLRVFGVLIRRKLSHRGAHAEWTFTNDWEFI